MFPIKERGGVVARTNLVALTAQPIGADAQLSFEFYAFVDSVGRCGDYVLILRSTLS